MESREQRITTLATTLRSSGIAKSDSQARMMAEDMIGVEEHVQRDYEVEHARAHEYLQTAKNLGTPRQTPKPEPQTETKAESKVESKVELKQDSPKKMEELYTSRKDTSKTDHDTHNSALEAIKSQVSAQKVNSYEDTGSKTGTDSEIHVFESKSAAVLEPISEPLVSAKLADIKLPENNLPEASSESISKDIPENKPENSSATESVESTPEEQKSSEESKSEEPKLDAQKLIDMMEEDGKLEEHTREIKEKPKDVKPKEAYEENNIDLGNVFNFNKK